MDLAISQADSLFRDEVREFINANLSPNLKRAGLRMTSIFSDFDAAMEWQAILYRQGWLVPEWPEAWGGNNWSLMQRSIFQEESKLAGAPTLLPMGIQMLGPILLKYGTAEQKAALLPRILSGEDIWCQGYSEPNAGSDLASLSMKAEREGDSYILNGTKIWTSFAHRANKIFCLVRTAREGKPQAGISFVLVDMTLPGVTVAPIVSLDGEVEQCQVFFEDVRIPASCLVGQENQGWEVAKYLLEFERGGYSYYVMLDKQLGQIRQLAAQTLCTDDKNYLEDELFSNRLAELEIDKLALEYVEHRIKSASRENSAPGVLSSMAKVVGTELSQQLDLLALELRGCYLAPAQNQVLAPDYTGSTVGPEQGATVMNAYLNNRASTIYGGTAQVQRNIIAKQVLGL
ncbi:acyl-CoA dehydrogenase family protein [Halioxenophilus sp. WMMB6]|uniref:acyl-CoA dehydrogenase family protein n=1 Tax=Halioxenophilus sp. WMMB6 TaxID=3073815 RepID=UPI00295E5CEA|nr:acyl-CoA dehydrogenase family protein [Halioxenophilus sp. WMMB6]